MSDNRTVATDAMATLGTIIDETAKRDAIHLAVIPMVAGEWMEPGWRCFVRDGEAWHSGGLDDTTGIVDPFLMKRVQKGQRFWLVILPRTIQSLRHVWAHPAFPDEPSHVAGPTISEKTGPDAGDKATSEKWLRSWCYSHDAPDYEDVMERIRDMDDGEQSSLFVGDRESSASIPDEFWGHVEIVTGRKFPGRPKYFSCSC